MTFIVGYGFTQRYLHHRCLHLATAAVPSMPKLKRNTRLSKKLRDSARKRALRSHQQLSAVEDQHSTDDHQESAQGNNQLQEPAQGNNQLQEPAQGNNHLQEPAQGNNQQQEPAQEESAQGNNQEAGQGNNQEAAQGNNQEPAQGESAQGINHEAAQGNNQEPAQGESAQGNNQEEAQGSNQDTAKGKNQESTQGNNQESSQGDHQESATFTLEGTEESIQVSSGAVHQVGHNHAATTTRHKRACLSRDTSASKRKRGRRRNNVTQAYSTHSVGCSSDPFSFEEASVPVSMQSHYCESLFNSPCCPHCKAYRWEGERESLCCCKGKVKLDPLQQPPSEMIALFNVNRSGSTFLEHIRAYNNALALASLGCNQVCMPGFNPNFKIQGKMFHRIGSLLPADNQTPKFAQLFFYDSDNELANRLSNHSDLDADILGQLQRMLHANNSYIQSFKAAIEIECVEDVNIVLHADKKLKPTNEHCRR